MENIQAALRHKDRRSTERYAKLARQGAIELLRRPASSPAWNRVPKEKREQ